jgi:hypothetical protein
VLRWSWWRRWHQATAHFHHYRRRAKRTGPLSVPDAPASSTPPDTAARTPATGVAEVWQRLQPLLPSGKRPGRRYAHDRRLILEAIVYQMQSGCAWNALPSHFPPYQTVYAQLKQWQKTGIWDIIWNGLEQPRPSQQLQL